MRSPAKTLPRLLSIVLLLALAPLDGAPHEIQTNRKSPVILPLPKGDDVFHFVVFGDRTGGPAEGIKVLAQAVEDTNLLDPDLVMTVGDLVNGYNQTAAWVKQMEEFRATMNRLKMPWFPVAGNHDIYWRRDPKDPEEKPPREHEEHYEKHFGPLWYWFQHKEVGFLVLFTDEGHPDGRERSFTDREQQRFSSEQMEWLGQALEKMKDLQHIFVFLHHPFWWQDRYPGNDWDAVHRLLVKNGKVRAVIAGHVHRMTYSGLRDGIDYYSLATSGGSLPREMEGHRYFGYLHHFNVVTVRKTGYTMASIPVGGVFDPKQFDALRVEDGDIIRFLHHEAASPPIEVTLDGAAGTLFRVALENPSSLALDATVSGHGPAPWVVAPDHRHSKVPPRGRVEFEFACIREPGGSLEGYRPPEFELRFDVLTPGLRIAMPARTLRAGTRLRRPEAGWPEAKEDGHVVFGGKPDCLRLDPELWSPPSGPFTVEAWVKPAKEGGGSIVSNRKDGKGFGIEIREKPAFLLHAGGKLWKAEASEKLAPGRWHHVAGVHEGERITLFVGGRRAASIPVTGAPEPSASPLYVGAMPGQGWVLYDIPYAEAFWEGAVDDLRLSRGARYREDFDPPERPAHDAAAVFTLPCDQRLGPFLPAGGEPALHAVVEGKAKLVNEGG
jgi:hypothetical protein